MVLPEKFHYKDLLTVYCLVCPYFGPTVLILLFLIVSSLGFVFFLYTTLLLVKSQLSIGKYISLHQRAIKNVLLT